MSAEQILQAERAADELMELRARVSEQAARLRGLYAEEDRLAGKLIEFVAAFDVLRDAVLNDRGPLAEEGMTSDQTNAVLALIDSIRPPLTDRAAVTVSAQQEKKHG